MQAVARTLLRSVQRTALIPRVPSLVARSPVVQSGVLRCNPSIAPRIAPIARAFSSAPVPPQSDEKRGYVVLSMLGKDKVGIVRDFSHYLTSLGANVEESRMARLGGEFAVIVLVSLRGMEASEGLAKFKTGLESAFPDFQIHARLTEERDADADVSAAESSSESAEPELLPFEIQVDGPDSPGIVAAVTKVLASRNITLSNVETQTTSAAFSGYPLFRMDVECRIPPSLVSEVERDLESVEEKFGVAISVFELEEDVLDDDVDGEEKR
ncbi:hypothetical protein M427DRAFT_151447 [Gonapodya prolifera JEL478]|uniref:ACT domain-containing protein n=1 Tax=Gonapodya prolifera (strain JEL478) TaxID=1344416 RepID=A0A139AY87_GONPJ|nr:hypothetical protein M427DRAFT_151447 [Gonapodya prolifera JEL478]|eukprot:KXS21415.1 hypothetical protein M427DRAFT_151447 [Gonapodya prolifera JEL478]